MYTVSVTLVLELLITIFFGIVYKFDQLIFSWHGTVVSFHKWQSTASQADHYASMSLLRAGFSWLYTICDFGFVIKLYSIINKGVWLCYILYKNLVWDIVLYYHDLGYAIMLYMNLGLWLCYIYYTNVGLWYVSVVK